MNLKCNLGFHKWKEFSYNTKNIRERICLRCYLKQIMSYSYVDSYGSNRIWICVRLNKKEERDIKINNLINK